MATEFDVRGVPEVRQMLEQVQGRELNNRMRRALRRGAKVFREALRDEARSRSDLPTSFAKIRTRAHRNPLGVSVSPKSPLSTIFEHGASAHQIGAPGQLLSNFEGRRQAGPTQGRPFFARGPVRHPGMAARPFIGPTFDAAEGRASEAMRDELLEGLA